MLGNKKRKGSAKSALPDLSSNPPQKPSPASPPPAMVRPHARELSTRDRFREYYGDGNAFRTFTNHIHFHPDLSFGGFGFMVLTEKSALRAPGVYLADKISREWVHAYNLGDLPQKQWVVVTDWDGVVMPFQLWVESTSVVMARWLSRGGQSLAPGKWDIAGGPTEDEMLVAKDESEMIKDHIRHIH